MGRYSNETVTSPDAILCYRHNDGDPFELRKETGEADSGISTIEADVLDRIIKGKAARTPVRGQENKTKEQVFLYPRNDSALLKCLDDAPVENVKTVMGITEDNQGTCAEIVCYRAEQNSKRQERMHLCGPHSEWSRGLLSTVGDNDDGDGPSEVSNTKSKSTKIRWIDLRHFQEKHNTRTDEPFLSTEAGIVQFFRSILTSSHEASPWAPAAEPIPTSDAKLDSPDIVVLVLNHDSNSANDITTLNLLKDFRVSDVAPSWFFQSLTVMENLERNVIDFIRQKESQGDFMNCSQSTLLVYKKLRPRSRLSATKPVASSLDLCAEETLGIVGKGCLWEELQEEDENGNGDSHCDEEDDNSAVRSAMQAGDEKCRYRLVSPPYLNLDEEYPGENLVAKLFSKEAMRIFTEDALSVPQWTPWPETTHYRASSFGNEKPWTVFPLCHCFPANKPENFTWVPATKAFVPRTCQLLEEVLSCGNGKSYLRTALFSQLAPCSVLHEHTGWADLANHVLRLHIPLVVPKDIDANGGNDDLCGTWVDGCVETHAVGRPLLFDDSKVHRAFNYSDEVRTVLIVDLARPDRLPLGTAVSGHTEELDAFIEQMSTPK